MRAADARQAPDSSRRPTALKADIEAAGWKVVDQRRVTGSSEPGPTMWWIRTGAATAGAARCPRRGLDAPPRGTCHRGHRRHRTTPMSSNGPSRGWPVPLTTTCSASCCRIAGSRERGDARATRGAMGEEASPDEGGRAAYGEVVWLAARGGVAAALNAGIRRAASPIVILLDPAAESSATRSRRWSARSTIPRSRSPGRGASCRRISAISNLRRQPTQGRRRDGR